MTGTTASSTHPPLPPTTEEDRLARLRLLRSPRVGVATWWRLMRDYGSATDALAALPDIARAAGVSDYTPCPEDAARDELARGRRAGAMPVLHGDVIYPATLATITDPPPLLWMRGDAACLARPMIALVGARNASSLGLRMARSLADDLGTIGLVVVSGLARGIDAAAHEAALGTGTVAVMAGGIDVVYPREHADLARRITKRGVILSEQPPGLAPQARHFPTRNRIIAGLAHAVIVVEGALKSGSLITARDALDLGREVMAVPGHPFDSRAGGCNALLRDGATLVRNGHDIRAALDAAGLIHAASSGAAASPPSPALGSAGSFHEAAHHETAHHEPRPATGPLARISALHRRILDRLGPVPVATDDIIRDLGAPARIISPVLTELELDGHIRRTPGGGLARAP